MGEKGEGRIERGWAMHTELWLETVSSGGSLQIGGSQNFWRNQPVSQKTVFPWVEVGWMPEDWNGLAMVHRGVRPRSLGSAAHSSVCCSENLCPCWWRKAELRHHDGQPAAFRRGEATPARLPPTSLYKVSFLTGQEHTPVHTPVRVYQLGTPVTNHNNILCISKMRRKAFW